MTCLTVYSENQLVKVLPLPFFACFLDRNCNCNCHTNHWVVTSTDKSHHFYADVPFGTLQGLNSMFVPIFRYTIRHIIRVFIEYIIILLFSSQQFYHTKNLCTSLSAEWQQSSVKKNTLHSKVQSIKH